MKEPKIIKLDDGGNKLTFKIYPFPATKAEDLLIRVALLAGKNMNFDSINTKEAIKAVLSAPYAESKEILDELLKCVYRVCDGKETQFSYDDADGYISSPLTLLRLRKESVEANFGFFPDYLKHTSLAGVSF